MQCETNAYCTLTFDSNLVYDRNHKLLFTGKRYHSILDTTFLINPNKAKGFGYYHCYINDNNCLTVKMHSGYLANIYDFRIELCQENLDCSFSILSDSDPIVEFKNTKCFFTLPTHNYMEEDSIIINMDYKAYFDNEENNELIHSTYDITIHGMMKLKVFSDSTNYGEIMPYTE